MKREGLRCKTATGFEDENRSKPSRSLVIGV